MGIYGGIQLPNINEENLDDKKERKQILNYLALLDEKLRYMFQNIDIEENLSADAQKMFFQYGKDITNLIKDTKGSFSAFQQTIDSISATVYGEDGAIGQRGTGLLPITTAPSSYTTAVNGLTPAYRIALSTVKAQSGLTDVFVGDTIRYSYYHYPIIHVDASYAYTGKRVSIRGAAGAAGTTPVKGTDYFTDADKAEIINAVKDALNSETWVFTLSGGTTVQKEVLLK